MKTTAWALVVVYMLVLLVAQLWPSVPPPPGELTDKHEHFFFYGILGALMLRALVKGQWRHISPGSALAAFLYSSLYGVFVEFCQRLIPSRSYEVADMVADAFGAALGVAALCAWGIIRRRSETSDVL